MSNPASSTASRAILCATLGSVLLLAAVSFSADGIAAHTLRLFIRSTARLSFALYMLVFSATSVHTLWPTPLASWLVAQRRYFGFSLAISHFSVAIALVLFSQRYNGEFYQVTYGLQRVGGAFGYLALLILVVTSFDSVKRRLSPAAWKATHTAGIWFLFSNFLVSYTRRTFLLHDLFFAPFLSVLLCGVLLRCLAWRRRRSSAGALSSGPAPGARSARDRRELSVPAGTSR
jgi:sulfoxide reductase heme-binding subunit YedZ